MLLTEEEWNKREKEEHKLLLTREEWLKKSSKSEGMSGTKYRGKDSVRWVKDKSKIRCFNCSAYGHFAVECKKPRRKEETKEEALMVQIPDEEPALLMVKCEEGVMLINEERITHVLHPEKSEKTERSNMWYLDNGASNHMSGQRE